jgi:hypothetical protein
MSRASLSHAQILETIHQRRVGRSPYNLNDEESYRHWRDRKLTQYPRTADELYVDLIDLSCPSDNERDAILSVCKRANMAIYRCGAVGRNAVRVRPTLQMFGTALGLRHVEDHRSAEADGIVAIEVASEGGRAGYIPYTDRPISWHTDGYYNYHGPSDCVQAMLLHCVRDAAEGGVNGLLDPEIAYIRLRDKDPALVAALMHPETMTIPAGEEAHGRVRPDNTGPVFFVEPEHGALVMRYTARKRFVTWRDDPITRRAVSALEEILDSDPLVIRVRLKPGEGLICNNVLHNRTAFTSTAPEGAGRLLYRVRYSDRIAS